MVDSVSLERSLSGGGSVGMIGGGGSLEGVTDSTGGSPGGEFASGVGI